MERLVVRTFEEEEYHTFFKGYIPDPMMDAPPFFYIMNRFPALIATITAVSGLIMQTTVRF